MKEIKHLANVFSTASKMLEELDGNVLSVTLLDGIATGLFLATKMKSRKVRKILSKMTIEQHAREIIADLEKKKEVNND